MTTSIIVASAAALAVAGGVITLAIYAFRVVNRLTGEIKTIHTSYQKEVEGSRMLDSLNDELQTRLAECEQANLKLSETLNEVSKEHEREVASRKVAESQRDLLLMELTHGDPKKIAGHINEALAKLAALGKIT